MIRSISYFIASRPDIMFTVYLYARFEYTRKETHLDDVKRIVKYIVGNKDLGLWYPRGGDVKLV